MQYKQIWRKVTIRNQVIQRIRPSPTNQVPAIYHWYSFLQSAEMHVVIFFISAPVVKLCIVPVFFLKCQQLQLLHYLKQAKTDM